MLLMIYADDQNLCSPISFIHFRIQSTAKPFTSRIFLLLVQKRGAKLAIATVVIPMALFYVYK